jgi:hypothetical protein
MKKLMVTILLFLAISTGYSQMWFQASIEHKFNEIAGLSVSNEAGYNFNLTNSGISISPSLDYTYFSDGMKTQTLLFQCITLMKSYRYGEVMPYVSLSVAKLDTYPVYDTEIGGSVQVGVLFDLSKNSQFFFQYRYFKYQELLEGQLTQFGIQYTF